MGRVKTIRDYVKGKYFLGANGRKNKKTLDYLILTHPDVDHYAKLEEILGNDIRIKRVFYTYKLSEYSVNSTNKWLKTHSDEQLKVQIKEANGKIYLAMHPEPKDSIFNDDSEFRIEKSQNGYKIIEEAGNIEIFLLAAEVPTKKVDLTNAKLKKTKKKLTKLKKKKSVEDDTGLKNNSGSIVTLIKTHGKKVIISGDATLSTESFLIKYHSDKISNVDLFTAGHHGSETSSGQNYVDVLKAKRVIFSAGYGNKHGLPRQSVINRLYKHVTKDQIQNHRIPSNTKQQGQKAPLWSTVPKGHMHVTGVKISLDKWRKYWIPPSESDGHVMPYHFHEIK